MSWPLNELAKLSMLWTTGPCSQTETLQDLLFILSLIQILWPFQKYLSQQNVKVYGFYAMFPLRVSLLEEGSEYEMT